MTLPSVGLGGMLVPGPRLFKRFRLPAALMALTVLYRTLGYLLLEGWSLTDAPT